MLRCCYVGHGLGWGGMLTFICTRTPRGCYVAATWVWIAGTQTLDRAWQDLKKYVPSEITAKDATSKKVNPALWDWIYSWMWRRNCKGDVWAAMPALFHWDRDCCKPAAKTSSAANGGVTLFLKAPVLFLWALILYIVRVPICFRANSVHVYAMVVSVRIPRMASHKSFHSCTSTILIAQDHSCSLIVQNNKLFFRQD